VKEVQARREEIKRQTVAARRQQQRLVLLQGAGVF